MEIPNDFVIDSHLSNETTCIFTLQLGIRLSIQPFPTGGGRADGQTCGKMGTSSTVEEGDSPIEEEGPPNSH